MEIYFEKYLDGINNLPAETFSSLVEHNDRQ